jgi:hypothetical protein
MLRRTVAPSFVLIHAEQQIEAQVCAQLGPFGLFVVANVASKLERCKNNLRNYYSNYRRADNH